MCNPRRFIALDAMGVIYRAGDDVVELLIPFIGELNGESAPSHIEQQYLEASRGNMSARDFWLSVGVPPESEDAYLMGHKLIDGLIEYLNWARSIGYGIGCISNDLSVWSGKLREKFELCSFISPWIVSADIGVRKPERRIYQAFLAAADVRPDDVLFIDDRIKNLDAAKELGIKTVMFVREGAVCSDEHIVCRSYADVRAYCESNFPVTRY